MNQEVATALGCIMLAGAGAGAFAGAVALADRAGSLGFAALVTIWLLLDDALGIHDHAFPAVGVPEWILVAADAVLVGIVLLSWPPGSGDLALRIALVAFVGWLLLQVGDPYPMRSGIVALAKLTGFAAWSVAVTQRAFAAATEGERRAPLRSRPRHR